MPELDSFSPNERRHIWQRFYLDRLWSIMGVLFIAMYAACVMGAMMLADYISAPYWSGIVVGNLIGAIVSNTILAVAIQRKIRAHLLSGDELASK